MAEDANADQDDHEGHDHRFLLDDEHAEHDSELERPGKAQNDHSTEEFIDITNMRVRIVQLSFSIYATSTALALFSSHLGASFASDIWTGLPAVSVDLAVGYDDETIPLKSRITVDDHGSQEEDGIYDDLIKGPKKPWGAVIGSTLLVNLVTLVGIIFLVPAFSKRMKHRIVAAIWWTADEEFHATEEHGCGEEVSEQHSKVLDIFIPSFAAGALLSTVVFLVQPEAISLLNKSMTEKQERASNNADHANSHRFLQGDDTGHNEHNSELDTGALWRFGAGILGGYLLPILLGALFPRCIEHKCGVECGPTEEDETKNCLRNYMVGSEHCAACDEDGNDERPINDAEGCDNHNHSYEHKPDMTSVEHAKVFRKQNDNMKTLLEANKELDTCSGNRSDRNHSRRKDMFEGQDCNSCTVTISTGNSEKNAGVRAFEPTIEDPESAPSKMFQNSKGTSSILQVRKTSEIESGNPPTQTCQTEVESKSINYSLCLSILLGDGLHNFCDGVFIGVAFMLCDDVTAWVIVAVTLYHEIAQELADFFLLTRHAGLAVTKALVVNFLAGLSVVLGGIIVLAMDVSDLVIGVILSIASGVYLHIATSECIPRVNAIVSTNMDRLATVVAFIVGAVPISLTLLKHDHCGDH